MKTQLRLLLFLQLLAFSAGAQIIRPFTARYYNPSVKGNIVYVSNSIISTAGVGSGSPGTGEIPPAGSTKNNSSTGINIDVDNYNVIKLPFASTWNYFARGSAPSNDGSGNTWKQSAYTLTGLWNTGASPVNGAGKYGFSSSQTTCIPSGGGGTVCVPTGTKYSAYYYRTTVNFTAAELSTTFQNIQLNMLRNDGIVVYINGVERVRNNMPTGTVSYSTLASSSITPGSAEAASVNLSPSYFTAGVNTIAVEVHLRTTTSADMSFDMEVQGLSDNGTYNSSTADLTIPTTCNQVLFAGLYWGADQGTDGVNTSWINGAYNSVQLKIPGSSNYQTITSTQTDQHSAAQSPGLPHTGYLCFADITSIINTTNANGTYAVGNVVGPIGIGNACGGWTIVIVYSNASLLPRNLTVFDGSVIVNQGDPAVVYDGDRRSTDSFAFKQNGAPLFYNLATTTVPFNNTNDAWNSKISYKSSIVTTRNPAFNNTLGYDASIFDLPNTSNVNLSNNQTSATVRFSSPGENYFVHVLTTSITQYNPAFVFDKTATDINGGVLVPGDSIRYQVNYNNVGNDSSTNTIIYDNIPLGSTFLPGSIKIDGVSKTDAAGDDQAEYDFANNRVALRVGTSANAATGGIIAPGVSGNIQFNVITASSCDILSCTGSLRNEARISYNGKKSGAVLYDSSGVSTSGCIIKGPVISPVSGSCFSPKDTLLVVHCPVLSVMLPAAKYAGYTFYSAMPFIAANMYNPSVAVTSSGIYWAYFNSGAGCSDTARIQVIITLCPDIDDDDDGIPDYVEFNDPLSLQDHNGNGTPNWNDAAYAGFVDNNSDGFNDNFDWGADSDNDGIPNFQDTNFWKVWVDTNGDGVNDQSDKDLDGIPNQYDRDSDNDGIPDVVESYGVDTNGDGIIDNFTETDYDGFSQNVDANNTGVNGSGVGLGAPDLDGDGLANYLDLDSDNDGIPDAVEVEAPDINNNGKPDGFVDNNGNGLHDGYELSNGLLLTGADVAPVNGRADDYPYKNKDHDLRPNPYDLDSDGDGIVDVIEAGFTDANYNGIIDGAIGANGWSTVIAALPSLVLRFTDADPYADYLDIDSDQDGIPDNIEGMSTAGYLLPGTTDADGDGLVNAYDNIAGFGGSGIYVYDHDFDGTPDYRDTDTDADGLPDIEEGNDFNLNGIPDDDVTLTGLDTDGDGLDNRFDSLNSVVNIKGTSYRMGTGGTFAGDAPPGSRTTVQKTMLSQTDRDWRFVGFILPLQFVKLSGQLQSNNKVPLRWTVIARKPVDHFEVERSTDNRNFVRTGSVTQAVNLNVQQTINFTDNVSSITKDVICYRIKVIGKAGEIQYSNILVIRKQQTAKPSLTTVPNPANDYVTVGLYAEKPSDITIRMIDENGKVVLIRNEKISRGSNNVQLTGLTKYSGGTYMVQVFMNDDIITQKLLLLH
jgi:uncharacterized repeat protein (TIGR01451 family)